MICARQTLGMPDNCAICKALQPEFYNPCHGEPDKVKSPAKKSQPEILKPITIIKEDNGYLSHNSVNNNLSDKAINLRIEDNSKNKKIRELSYEEAKREVERYIQTQSGKIHVSEISENLSIDIEMVEKIIEEL